MTPTLTPTRPETTTPNRSAPQAVDPNCSWCGGSGEVTDPQGQKWPCIQCNTVPTDTADADRPARSPRQTGHQSRPSPRRPWSR